MAGTDTEVEDQDLTVETEEDQQEADEPQEEGTDSEGGEADKAEGDEPKAEETEEVVVSLGDEPAQQEEDESRAPAWVRDLRKTNRELVRKVRELESQRPQPAAEQAIVVGDKPTLEGADFDGEKYAADLEAWYERKRKAEEAEAKRRQAQESAQQQWQATLDSHKKKAAAIKVRDYEEAEDTARDIFSVVQQAVILNAAENSALMVYALGKAPGKAKELAAINDPVKFAAAVGRLETQLKVKPRTAPPPPERTVRSGVSGASAVEGSLKKLQEEADRTGDRTKVAAYMRAQRQNKAA